MSASFQGARELQQRQLDPLALQTRMAGVQFERAVDFWSSLWASRPESSSARLWRVLEEFEDFVEKLQAWLLEQHEVGRVLDEHAGLGGGIGEVAHQSLAVLWEGPGVVFAGDHQRRHVDRRGVPHCAAGR